MNKQLPHFHLPKVIQHLVNDKMFSLVAHIRNFYYDDQGQQYKRKAETMNTNQRAVFQNTTKVIERSPVTTNFIFEGAGSTGKTNLYRDLCSNNRSGVNSDQDINELYRFIICIAFIGIADLLLLRGQIVCFFFAVPLDATLKSKLGASYEQARLL